MEKCRCKKESKWFLIDDSFDENSGIKGGEYSYEVGSEYEFYISENPIANAYVVIHKNSSTGFDEKSFNETFDIINKN